MNLRQMRSTRGFTVVEMVVVVGIIGALTSVVLFSVSQARENARDKTRLSDIKQLQVTLKLYQEGPGKGSYPDSAIADDPDLTGDASGIDADPNVQKIMLKLPKDPKGGTDFGYYYDYDFDCDGSGAGDTVIYVKKFETLTDNANGTTVCSASGDATADMYIIPLLIKS